MDKKISELDQAIQINNDAVFPMSQNNSGTDTTYKTTITQLSTEIGEGQTFSNLQTTDKTLVGAINEAAQGGGGGGSSNANIAPDYDATSTYAVGDWCIYNGTLYQCNTAIPVAEAFDPTHWTAKKVVDAFADIEDELDDKVDTADYNAELLPIESGSSTNTKDYIDSVTALTIDNVSSLVTSNGCKAFLVGHNMVLIRFSIQVSTNITSWTDLFDITDCPAFSQDAEPFAAVSNNDTSENTYITATYSTNKAIVRAPNGFKSGVTYRGQMCIPII